MSIQKFLGYYLKKEQKILSIMGPSGTGKSFSADFLCDTLQYYIAKQITTRPKRSDDKHYIYMGKDEFIRLEQEGKILGLFAGDRETLRGNGYGYLIENVMDELNDLGKIILFPSAYELEKQDFRSKYGTIDKIGLGFRDSHMVIQRALQCNKQLDQDELQSRMRVAEILTYIMENYSKEDKTFSLIYSDNGLKDIRESKIIQLHNIVESLGYDSNNLKKEIEEFCSR